MEVEKEDEKEREEGRERGRKGGREREKEATTLTFNNLLSMYANLYNKRSQK